MTVPQPRTDTPGDEDLELIEEQPEPAEPVQTPDGWTDLSGPTEDRPNAHTWIGAAEIWLPDKVAKHANLRLSFRAFAYQRVDVLEVYCRACRRPYDDVADQSCEATIDNTHLIGGNPGERKKRKIAPPDPDSVVEAGPSFSRVGVDALLHGGAI